MNNLLKLRQLVKDGEEILKTKKVIRLLFQ